MDNELIYPEEEQSLKDKIDKLHSEWRNHIQNKCANSSLPDLYVEDGFFPYYKQQKIKVLFIGREARRIGGCGYIDVMYKAFRDGKVDGRSLNCHQFHALMLAITYGLQNNFEAYELVPRATVIGRKFASEEGISYAFMNLSKFSNETDTSWKSNQQLINTFLQLSEIDNSLDGTDKKSFFAREIELLSPDIIIGMNLNEDEKRNRYKFLGELTDQKWYGKQGQVCSQTLKTQLGEYPLFDTFHFSAPNKCEEEDFYLPIMEAAKDLPCKR